MSSSRVASMFTSPLLGAVVVLWGMTAWAQDGGSQSCSLRAWEQQWIVGGMTGVQLQNAAACVNSYDSLRRRYDPNAAALVPCDEFPPDVRDLCSSAVVPPANLCAAAGYTGPDLEKCLECVMKTWMDNSLAADGFAGSQAAEDALAATQGAALEEYDRARKAAEKTLVELDDAIARGVSGPELQRLVDQVAAAQRALAAAQAALQPLFTALTAARNLWMTDTRLAFQSALTGLTHSTTRSCAPPQTLSCVYSPVWSEAATSVAASFSPAVALYRDAALSQPISTSVLVGDILYARYVNPALHGQGPLRLELSTLRTGDREQAFLNELGSAPGEFRGTLQTAPGETGVPGNHRLELSAQDWIVATPQFGASAGVPAQLLTAQTLPPRLADPNGVVVSGPLLQVDILGELDPASLWMSIDGATVPASVASTDGGYRLAYSSVPAGAQRFEVYGRESAGAGLAPGDYCVEIGNPYSGARTEVNLRVRAGGRAAYFFIVNGDTRCLADRLVGCGASPATCDSYGDMPGCSANLPSCGAAQPLTAAVLRRAVDVNPLLNFYAGQVNPLLATIASPGAASEAEHRGLENLGAKGFAVSFGLLDGNRSAPRFAGGLQMLNEFRSQFRARHFQGHLPMSIDQEGFFFNTLGRAMTGLSNAEFWTALAEASEAGLFWNFGFDPVAGREVLWGGIPYTLGDSNAMRMVLGAATGYNGAPTPFDTTTFLPAGHSFFSSDGTGRYRTPFVSALTTALGRAAPGGTARAGLRRLLGQGIVMSPVLRGANSSVPFLGNAGAFSKMYEATARLRYDDRTGSDSLAFLGGPHRLSTDQERLLHTLLVEPLARQTANDPVAALMNLMGQGVIANFAHNASNGHALALGANGFYFGGYNGFFRLIDMGQPPRNVNDTQQTPCGLFADVAFNPFAPGVGTNAFRDPFLGSFVQTITSSAFATPESAKQASGLLSNGFLRTSYYNGIAGGVQYSQVLRSLCQGWYPVYAGGASPLSDAQALSLRSYFAAVVDSGATEVARMRALGVILEVSFMVVPVRNDEATALAFTRGGLLSTDTAADTVAKLDACTPWPSELYGNDVFPVDTRYYLPSLNGQAGKDLAVMSAGCLADEFLLCDTPPREVACLPLNSTDVDLGGTTTIRSAVLETFPGSVNQGGSREIYLSGPVVSQACVTCAARGLVCSAEGTGCVSCNTSADCVQNLDGALCDVATHTCGDCTVNSDCGGRERVCDAAARPRRCVSGCEGSEDCRNAAGKVCDASYAGTVGTSPQHGRCIECSATADCDGHVNGPFCDLEKQRCGACTKDEHCGRNERVCAKTGPFDTCVPGCNSDLSCAATTRRFCEATYVDTRIPAQHGRCSQCRSDADCTGNPSGARCDLGRGLCVQCLEDPHCGGTEQTCNRAVLVSRCDTGCNDDADCVNALGKHCEPSFRSGTGADVTDGGVAVSNPVQIGRCLECRQNAHCAGHTNGAVCDLGTSTCGECNADLDCPAGGLCVSTSLANRCVPGCRDDSGCAGTPSTPLCDTTRQRCAGCLSNAQCPGPGRSCGSGGSCVFDCAGCAAAGLLCDAAGGRCVACSADADCTRSPRGNRCDITTRTCEPCREARDCGGAGWSCTPQTGGNACVFACAGCSAAGLACDAAARTCGECVGHADCQGRPGTPVCDTAANRCVACDSDAMCAGPGWTCSRQSGLARCVFDCRQCSLQGLTCVADERRCVECTADADCAGNAHGGRCDVTARRCTACVADSDCGIGSHCAAQASTGAASCVFDCGGCAKAGLACAPARQACVQCAGDADCAMRAGAGHCDPETNLCGACLRNADCGPVGWLCQASARGNTCAFDCGECARAGTTCDVSGRACVVAASSTPLAVVSSCASADGDGRSLGFLAALLGAVCLLVRRGRRGAGASRGIR